MIINQQPLLILDVESSDGGTLSNLNIEPTSRYAAKHNSCFDHKHGGRQRIPYPSEAGILTNTCYGLQTKETLPPAATSNGPSSERYREWPAKVVRGSHCRYWWTSSGSCGEKYKGPEDWLEIWQITKYLMNINREQSIMQAPVACTRHKYACRGRMSHAGSRMLLSLEVRVAKGQAWMQGAASPLCGKSNGGRGLVGAHSNWGVVCRWCKDDGTRHTDHTALR